MPFPVGWRQRGVTLAEACCTLAVAAILALLLVPAARALIAARHLEGAAAQLTSDLRRARDEAIARQSGVRLGVQVLAGGSCYVVHTGAAGSCPCAATGPARCKAGEASLRTVHLPDRWVRLEANVASLLFDPLRGTATPTATYVFSDTGGRSIHVIVNMLGRVRHCSPGAALPGYRAC